MNRDLELALRLADAADAITLQHFQSATLAVRTKIDMTPVSEADEATEKALREILAAERPDDGVVGEEFGVTGSTSRRWIIDPIDGTKNYVRGIPVYATLIALEENGRLVAGVVSAPALHRRWWASRGDGAFCNGRRLRVSAISQLSEAHLGYDSVTDFDLAGTTEPFLQLARDTVRTRGFGDFWIHMMVAEGAIEIALEPAVAAWDMAAIQIIVEEAGGRFSDLHGNADYDGGSGLSTNGLVHDEVLRRFACEQVMVVRTADLAPFVDGKNFDLVRDNTDEILDLITERHTFIDRPRAEKSPEYRQIIPYVLIRHGDSWFLLQRTSKQTEARLHHKLSLGLGGHINPDTPELLDGLQRELEEEVAIAGDYDLTFAGILSDNSTEVSRVHLGAVYILDAHDEDVTVRETHKMTGRWVPTSELAAQREAMETWSQIVYDQYIAR